LKRARGFRLDGDSIEVVSDLAILPTRGEAPIIGTLKWIRERAGARTIPLERLNASNDE
jgi:hypothetical protein